MALAVVCSGAMVLMLFIQCLLLLTLFVGFWCWVFILFCSTLCPFYFCKNLAREERIGSLLLLCSGCHVAVVVL